MKWGGSLTQVNLRNKTEAGVYEDWRRGGPIDDTEAGNIIGAIYNKGWNNMDFLVRGESNDIQVINPSTGIVVNGFINIITLWDKNSLLLLMAIREDENFLQRQASLTSSTNSKVIPRDASRFRQAILANSSNEDSSITYSDFTATSRKAVNITQTDIHSLLDNEWDINDITFNDETGQIQAVLSADKQLTPIKAWEEEVESQDYQQLENQIEQLPKINY